MLDATKPTDLDTTNKMLVGASADGIIILRWQRRITKADALNLAAWIVAIVGDDDQFRALLQAVQNT